jgi:hypothetical protein
MTRPTYNLKKMIAIGGAVFSALALPMVVNHVTGLDTGFVSTAQAAESGSKSGSAGQAQKGKPSSTGSAASTGGSMGKKIFRASPSDDSDRPIWAGVKGGKSGGGGKPAGAGSKKGDLFGDMVVLLRDANGVPILNSTGLVQVIAFIYDSSGNLIPLTNPDGSLVVIPYNAEGDLLTQVTIGTTTYDVYPAEVDLGRLSVGRSPTKVLDHALAEALAKLTAPSAVITLDATGRLVVNGVTIDSPLENLALYDAYMSGTLTVALPAGFNPASLLAAAADKTGTITVDTVVYMNSILGLNNLAADPDVYYNFSTYNYDRYTTWSSVVVTVLVETSPGVFQALPVNVYDAVFSSTNWVDPTAVGGADDFATAANDYLQVIEFVHDNEVR